MVVLTVSTFKVLLGFTTLESGVRIIRALQSSTYQGSGSEQVMSGFSGSTK